MHGEGPAGRGGGAVRDRGGAAPPRTREGHGGGCGAGARGQSHRGVQHFPSKAALREAVTRRWLDRGRDSLAAIAADTASAPAARLRGWLFAVLAAKRAKATEDPQLYAAYALLVAEHSDVAAEHVADLLDQLRTLIADGFAVPDPAATARAVFDATTRFHHPAHTVEWDCAAIESDLDAICALLLDGLPQKENLS